MRWVYEQLVRSEGHITDQIQNQQTRIATTLATTGVVLGLVASGVFGSIFTKFELWEKILLTIALGVLVVAVVAGILAMWPRVPIRLDAAYIDPDWIRDEGSVLPEPELYLVMVESFSIGSQRKTLNARRHGLWVQLGGLAAGLALISAALSGYLT
jgi:hypothetical protein